MPFREKSAWLMAFALMIGAAGYFAIVITLSDTVGELIPPLAPFVIAYTILLVVIAIVGHIIIAVINTQEAQEAADERDQRIIERAGHWSGYILGASVVIALGYYLVSFDGHRLFYGVFAGLMLSQLFEYVFRILLYRRFG